MTNNTSRPIKNMLPRFQDVEPKFSQDLIVCRGTNNSITPMGKIFQQPC